MAPLKLALAFGPNLDPVTPTDPGGTPNGGHPSDPVTTSPNAKWAFLDQHQYLAPESLDQSVKDPVNDVSGPHFDDGGGAGVQFALAQVDPWLII
jgi:hypothetical protein